MIDYVSLKGLGVHVEIVKEKLAALDGKVASSLKHAALDPDNMALNFYTVPEAEVTIETAPAFTVPLTDTREMYEEVSEDDIRSMFTTPTPPEETV